MLNTGRRKNKGAGFQRSFGENGVGSQARSGWIERSLEGLSRHKLVDSPGTSRGLSTGLKGCAAVVVELVPPLQGCGPHACPAGKCLSALGKTGISTQKGALYCYDLFRFPSIPSINTREEKAKKKSGNACKSVRRKLQRKSGQLSERRLLKLRASPVTGSSKRMLRASNCRGRL